MMLAGESTSVTFFLAHPLRVTRGGHVARVGQWALPERGMACSSRRDHEHAHSSPGGSGAAFAVPERCSQNLVSDRYHLWTGVIAGSPNVLNELFGAVCHRLGRRDV